MSGIIETQHLCYEIQHLAKISCFIHLNYIQYLKISFYSQQIDPSDIKYQLSGKINNRGIIPQDMYALRSHDDKILKLE